MLLKMQEKQNLMMEQMGQYGKMIESLNTKVNKLDEEMQLAKLQ